MAFDAREYDKQYSREHMKRVSLRMHLEYDADILQKLDSVENKQGYIKALIREDIAKTKPVDTKSEKVPKTIADEVAAYLGDPDIFDVH